MMAVHSDSIRRTDLKFKPADIMDAEEVVGGGETANIEQIQALRGVSGKAALLLGGSGK